MVWIEEYSWKFLDLTLPWPPSVNNYWQHTRHHVYISARGRAYRVDVLEATAELGRFGADARLEISIIANPPDRRRRDIDNLLKCTLDSLEHAKVFQDDSQVDKLYIERGHVFPGGQLEVRIQCTPDE
jgi:crossover junction endodeoxyribonuclease RusA